MNSRSCISHAKTIFGGFISMLTLLLAFTSCDLMSQLVGSTAVSGLSLDRTSLQLAVGAEERIVATVAPASAANKVIEWSSDSPNATVSPIGIVTAVSPGSAVITAKTLDGGFTASCAVTVTPPPVKVTGVSLDKTSLSIQVGSSEQLTAAVMPNDAADKSVTWSSDNGNASVSADGLVTGLNAGTATISALTADGSFTASCVVTINPVPVTGIALSKSSVSVWDGGPAQLEIIFTPANATNKAVTWKMSNSNASVSQEGLVTAIALGSAVATATSVDGSFTASCDVNVVPVPVSGVSLNATSITIAAGHVYSLSATVFPANAANKAVSWSTSDEDIAFVTDGVTTNLTAGITAGFTDGKATITVRTVDGSFTASCVVTVTGSLPHTYSEVLPAAIAFQNAINAAVACNDPAAPAHAEFTAKPKMIVTCYFKDYVNSGYTLNGIIKIDVLPDFTAGSMNGTVKYSGGIVSEIICNEAVFNTPGSGTLSVKFTDGASGTLDLASMVFTQN